MKLARTLPGFLELLSLELVLSVGIISAVIAVLIPGVKACVEKAELSTLFAVLAPDMREHVVDMALTGNISVATLQRDKFYSPPEIEHTRVTTQAVDGGIRVDGNLGQPFYLTFTPSIYADQEQPVGNVMWLCGNQKAPAGWTQPAQPGTNLPSNLVPSACRE